MTSGATDRKTDQNIVERWLTRIDAGGAMCFLGRPAAASSRF